MAELSLLRRQNVNPRNRNVLMMIVSEERKKKTVDSDREKYRNVQIPTKKLNITIVDDYNIIVLHAIVMGKLYRDIDEISDLEIDIQVLKDKLTSGATLIESKQILSQIEEISSEIAKRKCKKYLKDYQSECASHLIAYKKIKDAESSQNKGYSKEGVTEKMRKLKLKHIEQYLRKCMKYIDLDYVIKTPFRTPLCSSCSSPIENIGNSSGDSHICPNCGLYRTSATSIRIFENEDQAANSKLYFNIVNFIKVFYRFMGLQPINFNLQKVVHDLDLEFQDWGYPPAEEIREQEIDIRGKKPGTSLESLFLAMKACGYKNYVDGNLIAHHLWGWKLPRLLHLENQLIKDYILTQQVYDELDPDVKKRKSCPPVEYRLFKELEMRGCDYSATDFKIPNNDDSMNNVEYVWCLMCEGASKIDPTIRYIPS